MPSIPSRRKQPAHRTRSLRLRGVVRHITPEEKMPPTPKEALMARDFFRMRIGPRAFFSSPFYLAARHFGRKPLYAEMIKQGMTLNEVINFEATYLARTLNQKTVKVYPVAVASIRKMKLTG